VQRRWLFTIVGTMIVVGSIPSIYRRGTLTETTPQQQVFILQEAKQEIPEARQEIPEETIYVVKEGDSLWSISQKLGVSLGEIAKANDISIIEPLQIGDKLRIPPKLRVSLPSEKVEEKTPQIRTEGEIYQLKEGDSLWTIAKRFGVKVEDIAKANGISPDKTLKIGDKLLIPGGLHKQVAQTKPSQKTTTPQGGVVYQVRKGDSLWSIAKRQGVSVESIAKANNISLNKTLQIGEKLLIPGKGGSKQVASSGAKSTLKVVREGVLVRKGPGTNHSPLFKLNRGTQVVSLGQQGDWQKVALSNGKEGWIRRDMLGLPLAEKPAQKSSGGGGSPSVVNTALSYQGTRYVYGGLSSRGFDCSGFVKYVYQKHGVNLPHSASAQFSQGRSVSKGELQPGDLVFFRTGGSKTINHVGIYIGNGKFIHASSAGGKVRTDSLNDGYYKSCYMGARRLK